MQYSKANKKVTFPYIPGLLSFREIPVILEALKNLTLVPDIFVIDGGGYAHPRRFGLACHLGVLLEMPTIGIAKTPFVGSHNPVDKAQGSWEPLLYEDEIIGGVLRTRENVKPIYVSPGHLINIEDSLKQIMNCTREVRQPEPIRWAHHIAGGGSIDNL